MTHMGRILKAAAHILCGVSLIAICPVKSIAIDTKSSDFYPSPGPVIKPTEPPAADINRGKTNGDTAGILASAATLPPNPGKKTVPGKHEQSRKISPFKVPSQSAEVSAQLENTRPIEKSSSEESIQTQQIIPLEVPSRPASAQAPMGLSPLGYNSPYFHMERPRLGLGLAYIFDEDRREGQDTDTKDQTHEFKERLAIETRGWAYHPALLKYTLRFEPEWSQSIEKREPGENFRDNVFLPGYFADATILDAKPYTFYLFRQPNQFRRQKCLCRIVGCNH